MRHNERMREKIRGQFAGFVEFIRERGVMGLAIGFVLGGAVQKVVAALVDDILNPILGIFAGRTDSFARFSVGPFLIGDFVRFLIFSIIRPCFSQIR